MPRAQCAVGERLWMAYVSDARVNEFNLSICEIAAVVDGKPVARRYVHQSTGATAGNISPVYGFEQFFDTEREARIWLAGEITDRSRKISEAAHKAAEEQIKLAMECVEDAA